MNSRTHINTQKICYFCKEKYEDKDATNKKYCKIKDHCHYTGVYRGAAHSIYNLKYSVLKEITKVSLRIQSECEKIRTRITPNTDNFHAVGFIEIVEQLSGQLGSVRAGAL